MDRICKSKRLCKECNQLKDWKLFRMKEQAGHIFNPNIRINKYNSGYIKIGYVDRDWNGRVCPDCANELKQASEIYKSQRKNNENN